MPDFTITEDFPKSEIEFDSRFSKPEVCYDYRFKLKSPNSFGCKRCGKPERTAWIWQLRHRMELAPKIQRLHLCDQRERLSGRVEVDEFLLVPSGPVNAFGAPKAKRWCPWPLNGETLKNEWFAFDGTLSWTVQHIRWKPSLLEKVEPGTTFATGSWQSYNVIDKEVCERDATNPSQIGD